MVYVLEYISSRKLFGIYFNALRKTKIIKIAIITKWHTSTGHFQFRNQPVRMNNMKIAQDARSLIEAYAVNLLQCIKQKVLKTAIVIEYDKRNIIENLVDI